MVDGASDQLLARAAFAQNQDIHVLGSDAADLLAHGLHGGPAADQPVRLVLGAVSFFEDRGHVHQSADGKRLAHDLLELFGVQRFDQIVVGPQFHGLDGGVRRSMSRDEDDKTPGIETAEVVKDIKARAVAEANVQQDYVGRLFGGQLQTFGGRLRTKHLNGLFREDLLDAEVNARFVVNHQ